jgi:glutathione S-transferase
VRAVSASRVAKWPDSGATISTGGEILLLSPSILVPCLTHDGITVWDTLAIGEYLAEVAPRAGLLPADRAARAHCRAICGEMHSGFSSLRSALPMNLKGDFPKHKVWSRALGDIERIGEIWRDGLQRYGGPYLFGPQRCMADAMYAPVVTRFLTYHVQVDAVAQAYCKTIMAMPEMKDWVKAAQGRAGGDQRTRHGFLISLSRNGGVAGWDPPQGGDAGGRQSPSAAPACEGARFDSPARGAAAPRKARLRRRLAKSAGLTISMYSMSGE